FDDAIKILGEHPVTRSMEVQANSADSYTIVGDHFCLTLLHRENERVKLVTVLVSCTLPISASMRKFETPTLGQLIPALGNPDDVMIGWNNYKSPDIFLFFGGRLYYSAWNEGRSCSISPLIGNGGLVLMDQDWQNAYERFKWKGFASRRLFAITPDELAAIGNCNP